MRDITAGFKLWKRSALQTIELDTVRSNGYVFTVEMAYISEKLGLRIMEMPIHFEDRRIGQSKMDLRVKIESVWRVWELLWRYRKRLSEHRRAVAASRSSKGREQPTGRRQKSPTDAPT